MNEQALNELPERTPNPLILETEAKLGKYYRRSLYAMRVAPVSRRVLSSENGHDQSERPAGDLVGETALREKALASSSPQACQGPAWIKDCPIGLDEALYGFHQTYALLGFFSHELESLSSWKRNGKRIALQFPNLVRSPNISLDTRTGVGKITLLSGHDRRFLVSNGQSYVRAARTNGKSLSRNGKAALNALAIASPPLCREMLNQGFAVVESRLHPNSDPRVVSCALPAKKIHDLGMSKLADPDFPHALYILSTQTRSEFPKAEDGRIHIDDLVGIFIGERIPQNGTCAPFTYQYGPQA